MKTLEFIQQVISKHTKTSIKEITPLTGGEQANIFRVITSRDDLCVKLHHRAYGVNSLKLEYKAMYKLQELGIYTPKPIHAGTDKLENKDQDFLIMSFEKGTLLSDRWTYLNKAQKRKVLSELLDILDRINKVIVTGYGPLNGNLKGLYKSAAEYIQSEIKRFEASNINDFIEPDLLETAKYALQELSKSTVKPKFVHADFRLRNILIREKRLILFDFSYAMAFDPTFDFIRFITLDFSDDKSLNNEGQYLENLYKEKYYQGNDYDNDKRLFQLLLCFRLIPWFIKVNKTSDLNKFLVLLEQSSQ